MPTERDIAGHYDRDGLLAAILDAVRAAGLNPDRLRPADLAAVDEFHLGGPAATEVLIADLGLAPDTRVLDIGAGLGGPARHIATRCGCTVAGIDLTPAYVAIATDLTARCGLADQVTVRQGSALDLPFEPGTFDAVTLLHVGMNIADKQHLFAGMRRMLKPGGLAGVYDIMRVGAGDIAWPMPWAAGPATSFVEPPGAYTAALAAAGFEIVSETDRRQLALDTARAARDRAERQGPSPLGLHLLTDDGTARRFASLLRLVADGILAPVQIVARAV
jgi:SAM-dependent methyltransferase